MNSRCHVFPDDFASAMESRRCTIIRPHGSFRCPGGSSSLRSARSSRVEIPIHSARAASPQGPSPEGPSPEGPSPGCPTRPRGLRHRILSGIAIWTAFLVDRDDGRKPGTVRPGLTRFRHDGPAIKKERKGGTGLVKFSRITRDPLVMGGTPCIRGLRVTVGTVVGLMASCESRERILEAYPSLEPADLDEALAYAAWRLEEREEELVGQ